MFKTLGRSIFVRLLGAVLILALSGVSAWIMFQVSNYYSHLDAYSGHVSRGDESAARQELEKLEYYYTVNYKLADYVKVEKVSELGSEMLFKNFFCHRAAFYNLTRNFGGTLKELQDQESFCAYFLRGNAKWRQAQSIYANGLALSDKDKKEKEAQLKLADELGLSTADDYEAALKANPSSAASSWNYDLVSNDKTRAMALKAKPGQIKVRLGQSAGGTKNPGPKGEDNKEGEGKKLRDIETEEKGPGNPNAKPKRAG